MKTAVFLDRDGTLIQEREYLCRTDQVALLPGAAAALRRLQKAGFLLILVTNQSGVGRGYFSMEAVEAVHRHLAFLLESEGVRLEKIYVAPEAPGQPSRGRKPSPQFLFDAREEFELDLASCYMVGDKRIDLECGWNAGVRKSILVRTGYGREVEQELGEPARGAVVCDDLPAAADLILRDLEGRRP